MADGSRTARVLNFVLIVRLGGTSRGARVEPLTQHQPRSEEDVYVDKCHCDRVFDRLREIERWHRDVMWAPYREARERAGMPLSTVGFFPAHILEMNAKLVAERRWLSDGGCPDHNPRRDH